MSIDFAIDMDNHLLYRNKYAYAPCYFVQEENLKMFHFRKIMDNFFHDIHGTGNGI